MRVALELPPLSSVDQYSLRPRIESSTVLLCVVCVCGGGGGGGEGGGSIRND